MTAPPSRAEEETREYVLIKRGLYWRPNGKGYTGLLSEAGRYSASQAAAYSNHDNDSTRACPADEAEEFAPKCWHETKLAFRTKERDAALARASTAEAEVERLKAEVAFVRNWLENTSNRWMTAARLAVAGDMRKLQRIVAASETPITGGSDAKP